MNQSHFSRSTSPKSLVPNGSIFHNHERASSRSLWVDVWQIAERKKAQITARAFWLLLTMRDFHGDFSTSPDRKDFCFCPRWRLCRGRLALWIIDTKACLNPNDWARLVPFTLSLYRWKFFLIVSVMSWTFKFVFPLHYKSDFQVFCSLQRRP
jgi:hypothetical protein